MAKTKVEEVKTAEAPVEVSTDAVVTEVVADKIRVDTSVNEPSVNEVKRVAGLPTSNTQSQQETLNELKEQVSLLTSVCIELLEIGQKTLDPARSKLQDGTRTYLQTRIAQLRAIRSK